MRSFRCLSLRLITICALTAISALAQTDVVFITEENSVARPDSLLVWETPLANLSPVTASNALGPVFMFPARKPVARIIPGTNNIRVFVADSFNINILEYTPDGAGTGQFVVLSRFSPPSGNPGNVAVNSTLDRLYVGTGGAGYFSTILEYDIGTLSSGTPNQSVGLPLRSFTLPLTAFIMTINPQGTRILAMDGGGQQNVADVDLTNGVASLISTGADHTLGTIKIEPSQGCYGYFPVRQNDSQGNPDPSTRKIGVIDLCSSNPGMYSTISITGATSSSGIPIGQLQPADLDFDPIGNRAYFSTWPAGLYTSSYVLVLDNVSTGGSNPHLSSTGFAYTGYSLSISPITRRLYLTSANFSAFDIDPATGDLQTSGAITTGFPTGPTAPIAGVATIPITTIKAKAVVTNDLADLTPLVSINTTANTVIENIAIGATANLSTTSPQGSGLTTDPRYNFNGWIKDPAKCGDPSTNPNLAITSDPASFPGPDTYCACFEKQFYVGVQINGACSATLNGTAVTNGGGIWVAAGATVTGAASPDAGAQVDSVSGPVVADSPGKSIDIVCSSLSVCAPQSALSSLVGWYSFEDTSTISADRRGTNNYLQPAQGLNVVRAAGYVGQALKLGTGGGGPAQITAGSAPELDFTTNDFSIDAWIKYPQNTGNRSIADKFGGNTSGAGGGYSVFLNNGRLSLSMTPAGLTSTSSATWIAGGARTDDDIWHHIAVVVRRNQTAPEFYVDGILRPIVQTAGSMIAASIASSSPLRVGGFNFDPSLTDGLIDELEIFNAAISSQDVQTIFSARQLGKCPRDDKGCVPAPDGMVSWYKFEEAAPIDLFNDSTTVNVPLKASGPITRNAGKVGQSVYLSAQNIAFLQANSPAEHNFGTGDFSFDFWIRPEVNPVSRIILDKTAYSGLAFLNMQGFSAFIDTNGRLGFQFGVGGAPRTWTGTKNVADNAWHHITVSVSRTASVSFFIDGSTDTLTANPAMLATGSVDNTTALTVGKDNLPFQPIGVNLPTAFWIDELEFFNRALAKSEADAIFLAGEKGKCSSVPVLVQVCVPQNSWQPGLVAWYGFEAANSTFVGDLSGNANHGAVSNGATQAGGRVGDSLATNPRYVDAPSSTSLNFGPGPFSADLWMRWSDRFANLTDSVILSKSNATTGWWFGLTQGSSSCGGGGAKLVLVVRDTNGVREWSTPCQALATASWRLIGFRYNPGPAGLNLATTTFFADGVPVVASSFTGSTAPPNTNSNAPLRIGAASWTTLPSLPFTGDVDEVEIFNIAKPDLFFLQVYDAGSLGKCNKPAPLTPTVVARVTVVFQGCSSPISVAANYPIVGNVIQVPIGGNLTLTFGGGSIATVVASPGGSLTITNNSVAVQNVQGNITITVTCGTPPPECAELPANAVGWYSFEETSGALSHDSEGQDDYLSGGTPVRGPGMVGQALSFGTITDRQQTNGQASDLNFGTGDFTIDFWMKYEPFPLAGSPPVRAILEKRTGLPSLGYAVSLDQQGRIRFTMAGGGTTSHWIGSTTVTTNNWVFVSIVVRRNQANPAIYIDGSSTADVLSQTAAMITTNIDSAAPLVVGNNIDIPQSSPSYPVRGLLDELELFDAAVPVAELTAIYRAGANGKCDKKQPGCIPPPAGMVAWYKLDETTGQIANDSSTVLPAATASYTGSPNRVPGKVLGATRFLSTSTGFAETAASVAKLNFGTGDFSVDFWISSTTSTMAVPILSKWDPSFPGSSGWQVELDAAGFLQLTMASNGFPAIYKGSSNVKGTTLRHVVISVNRALQLVRFFVDGQPHQLSQSMPMLAGSINNSLPLRIGGWLNQPVAFPEMILDEVELFNRALTQAEAQALYEAGDKGKCVPPPPCDGPACTPRVRLDVQYQAIPAPPPNTLTAKIATFNQILNYSTLVPSGAQVPLDVDTPQQTAPGERYAFVNWSDGGAKQHSTTPLTAATNLFVVTFKKQLLLTVNASDPNCTGFIATTPSSPDGYFDFNSTVTISATGNGSTCVPSSTQPIAVTMTNPQTVTVNFTGATSTTTTIDTNPSNLQVLIDGQNAITPRSVTWTPNSTHTLFAITPQTQAGRRYRFAAWSGPNVANPQQNPLLVTAAAGVLTYRAAFNAECHLTVNVTGQGTVASEPSSTDGFYPCGSTVTLRASAASGWTFQSYSGAATGTNTTATVLLDDSKTVTATFTQPQGVTHTFATNPANLQLTVDGASVNTPTSASWIPGSSHTLQAPTPQTAGQKRHSFNGWSGPGISGTQNPVTVTAPQTAAAYTANFVSDCRLTVTTTGQGTVTASPASTDGYYRCGSTVTLTAAPAAGWTFQGYGGAVSGTNVTTTVALDDGKTVTAIFVQPQSTAITVATSPAGLNVTVDGATAAAPRQLSWTPGSSHTLTAPTPQTATGKRYTFTSWTGPQLNSTSPTATVTAPSAPAAYTANFGSECLLTINVTGQGTVSTNPSSPSGFYPCGSSVLLTATPNSGWTFQGYAGAASGSSASVEVLMNDAKTVTATFVQQQAPPPAITIALAGISRTGDGIASRTVLLFNITNTGGSTASNINTTIGMTSTVSLQFTPTAATIASLAAGATSPLTVNINGSLAAGTPINVQFLGNLTTPGGQQQPINQLLRLTMP